MVRPILSRRGTSKSNPDAVIAESILNRLVVGAEIITLEGPNMRLEANTQ
ncbi:ATP-binding protein [Corynebacterium coyleae]|nr:ATP-binding protein [Corynebacterium coyleae]MDK8823194.1 ATP-binding protein [Corynebacterium coyleae]